MGVIQAVEDHIGRAASPVVIHIVRDVVEVEQISEEVVADAKLGVGSIGIAHGGELARLEAVERVALALGEVTAAEKPLLALDRRLLAMTVIAKGEGAMGDEIRNENLGRGGRGGRLHVCTCEGVRRRRKQSKRK